MSSTLTPEETRRHILYKRDGRELDPLVAGRMLDHHDDNPSLDYRQLYVLAVQRPLPDVAYHTAPSHLMLSILEHGLRVNDPAQGTHGHLAAGQPAGVYLSDVYEAMQGRYRSLAGSSDVWEISGLDKLAPEWRQDPLNPTCWVVLSPIHPRMLRLNYTMHD